MEKKAGQLFDEMAEAVEKVNEEAVFGCLLDTLRSFLKGVINKEELEDICKIYLIKPIHDSKVQEIGFTNSRLKYVLEELSAAGEEHELSIHKKANRMLLFLKGENYDDV